MSIKFNASVKPERGTEYLVDINDISVDHESNNRFTKSDIGILIQSISQYGQLEAVGAVRVRPENSLRLAYGFGRYEAIKQINESLPEDQRMKIRVAVFDGNDRDVFFRNLAENAHRNQLSHMDYSLAIRRMSENYGQSDSQIAGFFGRTANWVSQHRSLLSLDYKIQEKVHAGEIAMVDALALTKVSKEKQQEVVKEIKNIEVVEVSQTEAANDEAIPVVVEEDSPVVEATVKTTAANPEAPAKADKPAKKVKKEKIKEAIRKAAGGDDKRKRSWSELHDFFEVMVGSPAISDGLQQLAGVMLAIMKGELNDDSDAVEALEVLIGGQK